MYIVNPPAYELLEKFGAAIAEVAAKCSGHLQIGTNLESLNFSQNGVGGDLLKGRPLAPVIDALRSRPSVECNTVSFTCNNPNEQQFTLQYSVKHGIGHFSISNVATQQRAIEVLDAVQKHFALVPAATANIAKIDDATAEAFRFQQASVGQLQGYVAQLGRFLAEQIERQTKHDAERDLAFQQKYQSKEKALEEKAAKAREEFETQRKQFAAKVAEFETNEAKYMRRKLMVDARNEANQAKEIVTEPTRKMRRGIHVVFLVVLALAATGAAFYVRRILLDQSFDWHYAAAAGAFSATFISFAIYYIRWNDQWAGDHARHEFTNRQFNLERVMHFVPALT